MTNLIIPLGIPGCGKSTWAKTLLDLKYAIVSSDKIRKELFGSLSAAHMREDGTPLDPAQRQKNNEKVFDIFHSKIEERLTHGVDVFADATNLSRLARLRLVDIARATFAQTHVLLFKNPTEAMLRNERRDEDEKVPHEAMMDMYAKYLECLVDLQAEIKRYDTVTEICSVR